MWWCLASPDQLIWHECNWKPLARIVLCTAGSPAQEQGTTALWNWTGLWCAQILAIPTVMQALLRLLKIPISQPLTLPLPVLLPLTLNPWIQMRRKSSSSPSTSTFRSGRTQFSLPRHVEEVSSVSRGQFNLYRHIPQTSNLNFEGLPDSTGSRDLGPVVTFSLSSVSRYVVTFFKEDLEGNRVAALTDTVE